MTWMTLEERVEIGKKSQKWIQIFFLKNWRKHMAMRTSSRDGKKIFRFAHRISLLSHAPSRCTSQSASLSAASLPLFSLYLHAVEKFRKN